MSTSKNSKTKKSEIINLTVLSPKPLDDQLQNLGNEEWERVGRQEFLAGRLYPRGSVVIIDGATGAKKTWLMMYEARMLSLGQTIRCDSVPVKECRVVYIHADLSMEGCKERMLQLGIISKAEAEVDAGMFCLIHREMLDETFSRNGGDGQQFSLDKDFGKDGKNGVPSQGVKFRQSFEELLKHHRPDMVILDPLFGITSSDVSRGHTATNIIMYLKKLAQNYQACIVLIVNQNKGTAKNRRDNITGGAIFNNAVPIRETIFKLEQEDDENDEHDWSYVERLKDSFSPPTEQHPARFRFRLLDSKVNGKQQFKTGTFFRNVKGKQIKEKMKFKVQKVVYDFESDWPESSSNVASRSDQVLLTIKKVLTENPDGLNCSDTFRRLTEILPRCSKPTFNHCKDKLVEEGKVVETPTGRKNGKLLRLKKMLVKTTHDQP